MKYCYYKAFLYLFCLSCISTTTILAQNSPKEDTGQSRYWSPMITGLPMLSIHPDARSTGMANIGLATDADAFGIYHNMSKMGFATNSWGISLSYTPWMPDLVKDMNVSYLSGYFSIEDNVGLRHTVSGSLRYFNIGKALTFPNGSTDPVAVHPYEFAVDLGYAIRVHPYWSVGLALRYGISDYNFSINQVSSKAETFLGDLSVTYRAPIEVAERKATIQAAMAINNVGGKLTHDGGNTYLFSPAVFRLGVGGNTLLADMHQLGVYAETSKLMVPTLPIGADSNFQEKREKYYAQSAAKALASSWSDAPGGIGEELKEMTFSLGAEYTYAEHLIARAGYFFQDASKGTNGGLSLGAGIIYEFVRLDISYFLADQPKSPLNNTLRLSVNISL